MLLCLLRFDDEHVIGYQHIRLAERLLVEESGVAPVTRLANVRQKTLGYPPYDCVFDGRGIEQTREQGASEESISY